VSVERLVCAFLELIVKLLMNGSICWRKKIPHSRTKNVVTYRAACTKFSHFFLKGNSVTFEEQKTKNLGAAEIQ
jgi:hypothetical protein